MAAPGAITHSGTLEKMIGTSGTACAGVAALVSNPLAANSLACSR
jgi:hypothetical protein